MALRMGASFEIFRFALVGGVATAVHMAVASGLLTAFPQMNPFAANVTAFATAFGVSYVGHSRVSFGARGSLWKFLLTALFGAFASNVALFFLLAGGVPERIAVCIAALVSPAAVYLLSKFWVFRSPEPRRLDVP
jgi:putative flippase GtrA